MQGEQSTSLCDTKYKIVFLGDMGVGKTSIIQRFVKDQFDLHNNPTVGIDFLTRNITYQNKTYRLQLWDTAGQQKYKSLVPAYLRDANCSVFVYDISRPQSFKNLHSWIQLYRDHQSESSIGIILENKSDLKEIIDSIETNNKSETVQYVNEDDVFDLAKRQSLIYMKVSAKTGKGVSEAFQKIISKLQRGPLNQQESREEQGQMQKQFVEKFNKLKSNQEKRKTPCCYI